MYCTADIRRESAAAWPACMRYLERGEAPVFSFDVRYSTGVVCMHSRVWSLVCVRVFYFLFFSLGQHV